jgi:predicted CXXCH cytochrome family protein
MKKIFGNKMVPFIAGTLVFILVMLFTTQIATASPPLQEENPLVLENAQDCGECHLDIAENWSSSPHAHAFDDAYFQEQWTALSQPGECLSCHTTDYIPSTGEYAVEGVYCSACHGNVTGEHPPAIVSLDADTEYCGSCHTTTLSEWRSTGHAPAGVGCMDCHNPHNQKALFENPDDLCINCHPQDMERYLEDLHVQKNIGCVDCHKLVIPPDIPPDDGIVPTGHAFIITPATCVACHTDALHAGFSLPGYENGAAKTASGIHSDTETIDAAVVAQEEETLTPEQRVEALETALASRNITTLFQGGVVGIVMGGSTAWIVANNIRRVPRQQDEDKQEEEDGEEDGEEK